MQNLFTRFIEDESGATDIEYGLIAALISVGIICLLYTSPSPRDATLSRMPSSA